MRLFRRFAQPFPHEAISFLLVGVFAILGTALATAYPLRYGVIPGVIYGSVVAILVFGLGTLAGVLIKSLLSYCLSLSTNSVELIRTFAPAGLGLLFLIYGFFVYHNDRFEVLVGEPRPEGLRIEARDLRKGFGMSEWTYAFQIDPELTDNFVLHHQSELKDLPKTEIEQELDFALLHYRSAPIPEIYLQPERLSHFHQPAGSSEHSGGFSLWVFSSPKSGHYLVFGNSD